MKIKKFIALSICLAFIVSTVGCGETRLLNSAETESVSNYETESASDYGTESVSDYETDEEMFFDVPVYPEIEELSPSSDLFYKVDESWAHDHEGYYTIKNDEVYTLSGMTTGDNAYHYGIGNMLHVTNARGTTTDYASLYEMICYDMPTWETLYISMGNIEPQVVKDSDLVIGYGRTSMELCPVKFLGYSPCYFGFGGSKITLGARNILLLDPSNQVKINTKELSVDNVSTGENIVVWGFGYDSWESFDGGFPKYTQDVTVSWFEGTDYKEYTVPANCRVYSLPDKSDSSAIKLEGELSKNSYAVFDLSSVPSGTYYLYCPDKSGIITIEH